MDTSSAKLAISHPASRWMFGAVRAAAKTIGLLLLVLTIAFFVFSVLPSDPIRNALGMNASEDAVATMRRELGYDRPLAERYVRFLIGVFQLDFGRSIHSRRDVANLVLEGLAVTTHNGILTLGTSMLFSALLIAIAHLTNMSVQQGIVYICRALTSVPSMIVAIVIGLAVHKLSGGFASSNSGTTIGIVASLAVYPTCSLVEVGMTKIKQVQRSTFVSAALSFGMSKALVFSWCIVPVILTSWLGQVSNIAATIFVSSSVFEVVYSLPGLGDLLARAIMQNDLPIIQGVTVLIVLGFLTLDIVFERGLLPLVAVYGRRSHS